MRVDELALPGGRRIVVELIRRRGTRHLRLRIGLRNQLRISVPWHCSKRAALKFAASQRAWIAAQLAGTPEQCTLEDWLRRHPRVAVDGVWRPVVWVEGRNRVRLTDDGGVIIGVPADDLKQSFMRFARTVLQERTSQLAGRHRLKVGRVSVRDQSTRWGSCSSSRTISLNWRLLLIAPELQDSVLLHELAHLKVMNHSSRFHALLATYDPAMGVHASELDRLSASIMRVAAR